MISSCVALVPSPSSEDWIAEIDRMYEHGPRSWILGLEFFHDKTTADALPPVRYTRRGIAYALALTFSVGFYRARESAMWKLRGLGLEAEGRVWWWPCYSVVRDAVSEFVPYDDACRAALAVTIREIERH